jgi:hypothetical protein
MMDLNTHAIVLNNAAVSIAVGDKALRATDLVFQARGHTLKTDLQEGNWRLRSNKD